MAGFKLDSVNVRMYRPGLGDCFLLTFNGKEGTRAAQRHMLIDCGVLTGTRSEKERLRKIVMDIHQRTGGKLDILVATHEHADHISGFIYHQEIFSQQFQIAEVWLGWTEDKDDPEVKEIYSSVRRVPLQVLENALEELRKAGSPSFPYYKQITEFLQDNGMQAVKDIATAQNITPTYLRPDPDQNGPARTIIRDDFGGVRFHVLGPPDDPELLKRSDPPKTKTSIDRGESLNLSTAFALAVLHLGAASGNLPENGAFSLSDVETIFEMSLPFDSSLGTRLQDLNLPDAPSASPMDQEGAMQPGIREFFKKYYGLQGVAEKEAGPDWRRIDSDWLEAAGSLALNLDSDLNNTSLVLAIELGDGGKVLLFPGDAQYGNWLSWAGTRAGSELLKRTVFYKVGHHGSHNATLKQGGLSLMGAAQASAGLVAMIPVDTEKARTKKGWRMPEPELRAMLNQQANGRIILACEGTKKGEQCADFAYAKPLKPPAGARISLRDWQKFISAIEIDDRPDRLWIQYTLPLDD
jgi:hypothetical protein